MPAQWAWDAFGVGLCDGLMVGERAGRPPRASHACKLQLLLLLLLLVAPCTVLCAGNLHAAGALELCRQHLQE